MLPKLSYRTFLNSDCLEDCNRVVSNTLHMGDKILSTSKHNLYCTPCMISLQLFTAVINTLTIVYMVKPSKIFSRTRGPMIWKIGMQHLGLKLYKLFVNDGPGWTLTYCGARSNLDANWFEWGKLL